MRPAARSGAKGVLRVDNVEICEEREEEDSFSAAGLQIKSKAAMAAHQNVKLDLVLVDFLPSLQTVSM